MASRRVLRNERKGVRDAVYLIDCVFEWTLIAMGFPSFFYLGRPPFSEASYPAPATKTNESSSDVATTQEPLSGMLQAYLTERSLKEGHSAKPPPLLPPPPVVVAAAAAAAAARSDAKTSGAAQRHPRDQRRLRRFALHFRRTGDTVGRQEPLRRLRRALVVVVVVLHGVDGGGGVGVVGHGFGRRLQDDGRWQNGLQHLQQGW